MIRDLFSDIFSPYSSFGDRCLATFAVLAMLASIVLLGILAAVLVDQTGISTAGTATTYVVKKQVIPAHSTVIFVGKVVVPQYYPESYELHFKINKKSVSWSVRKSFFENVGVGDALEVEYGYGRLTNSPKAIRVSLAR